MEQRVQLSDLVEIAKRNGDYRRNYGVILGAFLYLRSIRAAGGHRPYVLAGASFVLASALAWLEKAGLLRQLLP